MSSFSNHNAVDFEDFFNASNVGALIRDGYTVIEPFFNEEFAHSLLVEMKDLATRDKMKPNRTHFATQTQTLLFSKPNIYEIDLHEEGIFSKTNDEMNPNTNDPSQCPSDLQECRYNSLETLFKTSGENISKAIQKHIPVDSDIELVEGDSGRTIKLQWNKGMGGCFPWYVHFLLYITYYLLFIIYYL